MKLLLFSSQDVRHFAVESVPCVHPSVGHLVVTRLSEQPL